MGASCKSHGHLRSDSREGGFSERDAIFHKAFQMFALSAGVIYLFFEVATTEGEKEAKLRLKVRSPRGERPGKGWNSEAGPSSRGFLGSQGRLGTPRSTSLPFPCAQALAVPRGRSPLSFLLVPAGRSDSGVLRPPRGRPHGFLRGVLGGSCLPGPSARKCNS